MRGAALLLLCGAAVGLTGCGGGRAAGGGELRLQREDLLTACRALRQAEAGVSAELAASKRAWRLVANGLPRDGANPWGDLTSPRTLELLDEEVRRTVEASYNDVVGLLTAERSRLDALADALLERETLDQIDAYRIAGLTEPEPLPVD